MKVVIVMKGMLDNEEDVTKSAKKYFLDNEENTHANLHCGWFRIINN